KDRIRIWAERFLIHIDRISRNVERAFSETLITLAKVRHYACRACFPLLALHLLNEGHCKPTQIRAPKCLRPAIVGRFRRDGGFPSDWFDAFRRGDHRQTLVGSDSDFIIGDFPIHQRAYTDRQILFDRLLLAWSERRKEMPEQHRFFPCEEDVTRVFW